MKLLHNYTAMHHAIKTAFYISILIFSIIDVKAQIYHQVNETSAPYHFSESGFGSSIAVYNDIIAIGDPKDAFTDTLFSDTLQNSGAVYIKNSNTKNFQKIISPDRKLNNWFGANITLNDDFLVVGSSSSATDTLNQDSLSRAGAVFIYKKTNDEWLFYQKLTAFDREEDGNYGCSVSINDQFLIIGSSGSNLDSEGNDFVANGSGTGGVYIYKIDTKNRWVFQQKITATTRVNSSNFGTDVYLKNNLLVVTSPFWNAATGAAYIFELVNNSWTQKQLLTPSDGVNYDTFGNDIAIAGTDIIIASSSEDEDVTSNTFGPMTAYGAVYIYQKQSDGSYLETQKLQAIDKQDGDRFGYSIAANNNELFISAINHDFDASGDNNISNAGKVYNYKLAQSTWVLDQQIIPNIRTQDSNFGYDIFMTNKSVFIGAPSPAFEVSSSVYEFKKSDFLNINGAIFYNKGDICKNDSLKTSPLNMNIKLKISPGDYYTITNPEGEFNFLVDEPGEYTIKPLLSENQKEQVIDFCQDSLVFHIEAQENIIGLEMGIDRIECTSLFINLFKTVNRRCFKNKTVINVSNTGTIDAINAQVKLVNPKNISVLSSEPEWSNTTGDTIHYIIPLLKASSTFTINVIDSVHCDAELGSPSCYKAEVSPKNYCLQPNNNWDKSKIIFDSKCEEDSVIFEIKNIGEDMSTSEELRVYENDSLIYDQIYQLNQAELAVLSVTDQYKSRRALRIETDLTGSNPWNNIVEYSPIECTPIELQVEVIPTILNDDPFINEKCFTITGSYDPNDKQALPKGITANRLIKAGTKIQYRIRFQNTGNDTALTVRVIDTLSANLDLASMQILATSHPMSFTLKGKNHSVCDFLFKNINLPDSTTNEIESHGFIIFSVFVKKDLIDGEKIYNKAEIFFDYNDAIITNTEEYEIGEVNWTIPNQEDRITIPYSSPLGISSISNSSHYLISPNPANTFIQFHHYDFNWKKASIYSSIGTKVMSILNESTVNIEDLPPGVYIILFKSENGTTIKEQFIKL